MAVLIVRNCSHYTWYCWWFRNVSRKPPVIYEIPYAKNGIFSISTGYPDSWTINCVAHILCHLMSVMDWPCWVPYDSEWFLRQRTSTCFPRYCGLLGVLCWGSGRRRSPHDGGWLGTVPVLRGRNGGETAAEWFSGCCFLLALEMMRTGDGKYSVWCFCLMFNLADSYCFVT